MQKRGYIAVIVLVFIISLGLGYYFSYSKQMSDQEHSLDSEAWELLRQKFYDRAIGLFQQYIEDDPTNFYAQNGMAWALFETSRYEEAIPFFEESIRLDSNSYSSYSGLGLSHYNLIFQKPFNEMNFEDAQVNLEHAISINQKLASSMNLQYVLGRLQLMKFLHSNDDKEKLAKAKESFKSAFLENAASPDSHIGLGLLALYENNHDEAITHFEKSIAINQNKWLPYHHLSRVYIELGQYETGIAYGKKAVEIAPVALTYARLATAYLYSGNYNEAVAAIDKSIELDPINPGYYDTKGMALYQSGRFESAIDTFEKSTEMHEQYGTKTMFGTVLGRVGKGLSLYQLSDFTGAEKEFRYVLDTEDALYARFLSLVGLIVILHEQNSPDAQLYTKELKQLLSSTDFLLHFNLGKKFYLCIISTAFSVEDVYECSAVYREI